MDADQELRTRRRLAALEAKSAGQDKYLPYLRILDALTSTLDEVRKEPGKVAQKALDATNAVAAGVNRGIISRVGLPFNPVDVVANVVDLGKAASGTVYHQVTGKPIPDILTIPDDRSGVVGSSDWIVHKVRKNGGGFLIEPNNPEYRGGLLDTVGSTIGGGAGAGANKKQEIANAALNAASGALQYTAAQNTDNPAMIALAGLVPSATAQVSTNIIRSAVRGPDGKNMRQRVRDLKAGGVDTPSVGLASGNEVLLNVENSLGNTSGATSVMDRNRRAIQQGIADKTASLVAALSGKHGLYAPRAIQDDLGHFRDRLTSTQDMLYGRLGSIIPGEARMHVPATMALVKPAPIPGLEAASRQFVNRDIGTFGNRLHHDIVASQALGGLPVASVAELHNRIGKTMGDVPSIPWAPVHGALGVDMLNATRQLGPDAVRAFSRADQYANARGDRLERLRPFINNTPDMALTHLLESGRNGDIPTVRGLMRSVTPDTRSAVAAHVLEGAGKINPDNPAGRSDMFSAERFDQNWNAYTPGAREVLLSGFPGDVQARIEANNIARAASILRMANKTQAHPSAPGAPTVKIDIEDPNMGLGPLKAATTLAIHNQAAKALTSPGLIQWLSRDPGRNVPMEQSTLQQLIAATLSENQRRDDDAIR